MKKIFFVIFLFTLSSQNELITRLKFNIHYSLQPDGVNPYYFKLRIFLSKFYRKSRDWRELSVSLFCLHYSHNCSTRWLYTNLSRFISKLFLVKCLTCFKVHNARLKMCLRWILCFYYSKSNYPFTDAFCIMHLKNSHLAPKKCKYFNKSQPVINLGCNMV